MKNKLSELRCNIEKMHTNSKAYKITNSEQLLDSLINKLQSKIISLINKDTITIDKLGK